MSELITGFPPVAGSDAKVLILGSMPSEESLRKHQYYAHPRNAFWPIMMSLLGQPDGLDYDERTQVLIENGIALWDTLQSCVREGSLDASIVDQSITPNDFATFFQLYPGIRAIFFNGQKSRQVYTRHVLPNLKKRYRDLPQQVLPSTSPAMASLDRARKTSAWSAVLGALRERAS